MPNIENLKNHSERTGSFNRKPRVIDTGQLEYTATTLLGYGTILFAVVLGLGSVTYVMIKQLKKD